MAVMGLIMMDKYAESQGLNICVILAASFSISMSISLASHLLLFCLLVPRKQTVLQLIIDIRNKGFTLRYITLRYVTLRYFTFNDCVLQNARYISTLIN